ncbi:hypothetical protein [Bradyrhizobium liaoningense]
MKVPSIFGAAFAARSVRRRHGEKDLTTAVRQNHHQGEEHE